MLYSIHQYIRSVSAFCVTSNCYLIHVLHLHVFQRLQILDSRSIHDTATMSDKTIERDTVSFIMSGSFPSTSSSACVMNTAHLSPRLLRHFTTLWVSQPSRASLRRVFESVMETELLYATSINGSSVSNGAPSLTGN
jgi:hypothetical protein